MDFVTTLKNKIVQSILFNPRSVFWFVRIAKLVKGRVNINWVERIEVYPSAIMSLINWNRVGVY